jgi:acyl carrier protein
MTMTSDLRQLLAEVFETAPERIRPTDTNKTIPNWDSLRHLQLVMALEQRYGLQIDTGRIAEITSVADVIRLVAAR